MSLPDPYLPDTPDLLTRSMSHVVAARIVLPSGEELTLDVEDGRLTWDETKSPRVTAQLTCRVPTDVALLARIDPRTGARVEIDCGYTRPGGVQDVHTIADLVLRSRPVSRPDDTMALTAQSDESLVIDGAYCATGQLTQSNTLNAIATVIHQVIPAAPVQWSLADAGASVDQQQADTDRWDTINDLADQIEAQVFDDGLRTWHVNNVPVLDTPAAVISVGATGTITQSEATLDRDAWANWVVVRYRWTSTSGTQLGALGSQRITSGPYAAVAGNIKIALVERNTPSINALANRAAAALVKRYVTRGRSLTVSAVSAYWLRPGHTVTVQLPTGPAEDHLLASVTFNLRTGLMDLTTRLPDNTGSIGA